jgi:leucyl aminopeptidase
MQQPYVESDRLSVAVTASTDCSYTGDLLVIPFYRPASKDLKDDKLFAEELKKSIPASLPADVQNVVKDLLDEGLFKGDVMSKQMTRLAGAGVAVRYVALVGLGANPKKGDAVDLEIASAARLGKVVATAAKDVKASAVGVVMPSGTGNAGVTQFLLGVHDAAYNDNRFKKVPEEGFKPHPLSSLSLLGCTAAVAGDAAINHKLTEMIASGVNFARDLVGAPPNSKTPLVIADLARGIAKAHGLQCTVLGQAECEARGMGGYLGVQQGSKFPPQFVHLTYKPENPSGEVVKVALVGKGTFCLVVCFLVALSRLTPATFDISLAHDFTPPSRVGLCVTGLTFDSGGYNLKAGAGSMIELMKFDMGGCAAVLGCAKAIGQLRPKNVEVHFITAVCENMISAEAMRPGDVLVASNGKTIEVLNTDAEGRLTLADALVYADGLGVHTIIDLATLTGACIVGLGEKLAGLYSPDDDLRKDIEHAAKRTDEGIWALPLEASYKELIKSPLADLKNIGAKGGGSITAALFLQEFVDKAKWAHIDMAGPVWDTTQNKPTGYGVKMLTDYILNLKPTK